MTKRRALIALALLLAAAGALYFGATRDRCGEWPKREPDIALLARARGALQAGAAKVDVAVPFPVPAGGYGPTRPLVDKALAPVSARAVAFTVGSQRLALVLLDTLLVTPQLRDAIAKEQPVPLIVAATHTHSGPGAFSPSAAEEYGALGAYRPEVEAALIAAARSALAEALAKQAPARLEVGDTQTDGVTVARSGKEVDRRVLRLRFDGEAGPIAQVLVISAHPTTVPRGPEGLHPDWPGLLAAKLEAGNGPVTLVLQGAAGNASVDRAALPTPEAVASRLEALVSALPTKQQPEALDAAWTEVHVALPRPDARNVVPSPLRPIVENAVCDDAEDLAVLHALALGDTRLLFVPVEPSFAAGLVLEEQAHARRVVSLADGYAGYVETIENARSGEGEARRQVFPPELLERLSEGARLAGETTE